MPAVSGSFTGYVTTQSTMAVPDQTGHALLLGAVDGMQKSSDALWNNARVSYWATSDMTGANGTQRGYYVNDHGADGRDWGTFEGKITMMGSEVIGEGSYSFAGGSGKYKGMTGGGTYKTRTTASGAVDCAWQGAYEMETARAHGR